MSENECSDNELDILTCVKEEYSLNDFLENNVTGPILYEDAIKRYENNVEKKVEDFYRAEVDYAVYSGATIFYNEKDYDHLHDLLKIVFTNVNLNYNLDIIFNNEDIVNNFATEEVKNKPENS